MDITERKITKIAREAESRASLEREGAGELMTKAISDVDDCVEGMRKFTTEIFDTGVALAGYAVMLFVYDWRLALLSLLFTPVSYICAAWMKKPVQQAGAAYKKAAGALSAATLDRAQNAVTYRICGCEGAMERAVPPEGGKPARGDVVLSHVTFGYGERPVLHDFSMTVRQGEQVTLVGRTGAAIRALPEGYATVCTDGMFSQGEWQLLSIARAAAADPAVLLPDEITADLDAATEAQVLEALRHASRGRTVLSVSHRTYESPGGRTVEIKAQ